jgi:hypothetical protein
VFRNRASKFTDGEVSVEDSVTSTRTVSGRRLHDAYLHDIQVLTFGLVRVRGLSLYLGPLELLRLGPANVTRHSVEWPIEGGFIARAPGGRIRIEANPDRLVALVDGYRPFLPRPIYAVTQLPIHHLFTRLLLLRVRGREPALGVAATSQERFSAAAVDLAFCATLTGFVIRRPRVGTLLGVAAAYHVACWSIWGRTFGGVVMRQRVVAVDGSTPSIEQSVVRLLALPFAWAHGRPVHDEVAGTEVVVA